MNNLAQTIGRRVLSVGAVIVMWWVASRIVGPNVFPGPPEVMDDLTRLLTTGQFFTPLTATLGRTILGFLSALFFGLLYGILAARVPWFRRAMAPPVTLLLFLPTLGVVLIGLVVIGTGTTRAAVFITTIGVFTSIGVYVRDAMLDLDQNIIELANSYKVTQRRRVVDIYIPYLTPVLLGAGRIAFNLTWKIMVLAEVFGFSGGLGYQIRLAFGSYNMTRLLAWMTVFVVALLVIEQLVRLLEKRVVRWA